MKSQRLTTSDVTHLLKASVYLKLEEEEEEKKILQVTKTVVDWSCEQMNSIQMANPSISCVRSMFQASTEQMARMAWISV